MDHSLIHENITKYGSKTRNGKEREGEIIAFSLNNWKQWQKFQKFVTKAHLMRATIIFFFAHQQLVIARKILATMLQHSLQNTFFFLNFHALWTQSRCGERFTHCGKFLLVFLVSDWGFAMVSFYILLLDLWSLFVGDGSARYGKLRSTTLLSFFLKNFLITSKIHTKTFKTLFLFPKLLYAILYTKAKIY